MQPDLWRFSGATRSLQTTDLPEEIRVHRQAQEAAVEFFYVEATEAQPAVLVDMVMSWILGVGRRGTDGQIKPLRLELTRPVQHRELLESHFGCRVRFKAGKELHPTNGGLDMLPPRSRRNADWRTQRPK